MHKTITFVFLFLFVLTVHVQDYNYLPTRPTHQIVKHTYYTLSYDVKCEQPEWVAYALERSMVERNGKLYVQTWTA